MQHGVRRTTRREPPSGGPGSGTRDQIVAAAEDLIARHGLEGLQVKAIAARVGIRPPSVFAHFAGRDDVVGAVVERLLGRLDALFDAPAAGTPEEELRARTRQLVRFLIENPADARILLRELAQAGAPDVERHDLRARLLERIYDRVAAVLHRGASTGHFRRLRTESFVAQVLGGILAQLAWAGWDVTGRPRPVVSRTQLIRDAEDLAVAIVWRRPVPRRRARRARGR
jgi:AcrR family transcriptional regulator